MDESVADGVFRALADAGRRRLLDSLGARNGQTLRELCSELDMARQSVSKHLAVLEAADLVSTQRRGREKLHFLNPVPINAIAERWMNRYDRARTSALADLKQALESTPMQTTTPFVYVTYIATTPEQAWTALTEPAFTTRYWGVALRSEWTTGAPITWELPNDVTITDDAQVVLAADPPRRLSYTWHAITEEFGRAYDADPEFLAAASAEPRSRVTFDVEPHGDAVKLTVTHDGFAPGSVIQEGVSGGWPEIVASLKTLLETGEPLTTAVG